jgi:hypothetical protein
MKLGAMLHFMLLPGLLRLVDSTWVIIGGLLSSMFLTLVIVPLVYYLTDRVIIRFKWNKLR